MKGANLMNVSSYQNPSFAQNLYKNEELLKDIKKSTENQDNLTSYKLAFDFSVDKKIN